MLTLVQVPVWRDNYAYLVIAGTRAFVVDSPEAGPILERLGDFEGAKLEAVVNTHHHGDHVGSNRALVEATGCDVVGPAHDRDRIPNITRPVEIGETIDVAGVSLRVLDVHAHTRGHIAYVCDQPFDRVIRHGHDGQPVEVERLAHRPALFVGDSLFLGGCGRLFEGVPADLEGAMRTLAAQNPEALVCCAHEYTASNFRFADHVLPDRPSVGQRLRDLDQERAPSGSSVPDTLARELDTNPFLLCLQDEPRAAMAERLSVPPDDVAGVLGAVRAAKDSF
jgi:hydroxyacylglutathione hydrolase